MPTAYIAQNLTLYILFLMKCLWCAECRITELREVQN